MDTTEQMLGIVSERDIVRALAANGARTLEMTAGQLMTRTVQLAHPDTTVEQAMQMMTAGRFRHLPVVDHGTLIGLISIGDVVKARIMSQGRDGGEPDRLRRRICLRRRCGYRTGVAPLCGPDAAG